MDELRQIMMHKLKMIAIYRQMNKEDMLKNCETITQELLKQKRKDNSREVLELRLLQSLSTRRVQAPYRVQQFCRESLQMMKIYDEDFYYDDEEQSEEDSYAKIVTMFVRFFQKQNCERRAQQLRHIYQKSVCQKSMLIPTILNWFADWVKKAFQSFLKNTLALLKKQIPSIQHQKSKSSIIVKNYYQIPKEKATLESIEEEVKADRNLKIRKSQLLSPQAPRNSIHLSNTRNNKIKIQEKQFENRSCIESPEMAKRAHVQVKSISVIKINEGSSLFNREMFFSAFYDEVQQYYKFHSIIPLLDQGHPKSFKKSYRSEEMRKKLKQIAQSMSRAQIEVKNSIDEYSENYELYLDKQREKQKKRYKKSLEKEERKNSILMRDIHASKEYRNDRKSSLDFEKRSSKNKSLNAPGVEASLKTIEIDLPQIPPSKQYSVLNRISRRYISQNHTISKQARVSAELYKEIREINTLFRKNSARQSAEGSPIQNRFFDLENLSKLNSEEKGVFRLPKIMPKIMR